MPISIADRITKPTARERGYKICIHGMPGVGKTCLAASAPNPLLIDVDRHGNSALLQVQGLEETPVFVPNSTNDIDLLVREARQGNLLFDTFILDTVTELQAIDLVEIVDREVKKGNHDPLVPSQHDYNSSTQHLRRMLTEFFDLKQNLIVVAHSVEDKDEITKQPTIRPALTPKIASTIHGLVDMTGYLEYDNGEWTLTTMPSKRLTAKNRLGLPDQIKNPTWDKIMSLNGTRYQTPKAS